MRKALDKFNSHNAGDDMGGMFAPAREAIERATGTYEARAPWKGKDKRNARRATINAKHAYLAFAMERDAD